MMALGNFVAKKGPTCCCVKNACRISLYSKEYAFLVVCNITNKAAVYASQLGASVAVFNITPFQDTRNAVTSGNFSDMGTVRVVLTFYFDVSTDIDL